MSRVSPITAAPLARISWGSSPTTVRGQVDVVDHQVQGHVDFGAARSPGRQAVDFDEAGGLKPLHQGAERRVEPLQQADLNNALLLAGEIDQFCGFFDRGGERLLDQHVAIGFQAGSGDLVVFRGRHDDADRIRLAEDFAGNR